MIRIGTIYIVQNTCNVEVREIDPHGTHEKTVNFLACTAVVMGLLYQFERKVDFILPMYNLMILSTSPFIIYHFCGIPSSNYCCFPKF